MPSFWIPKTTNQSQTALFPLIATIIKITYQWSDNFIIGGIKIVRLWFFRAIDSVSVHSFKKPLNARACEKSPWNRNPVSGPKLGLTAFFIVPDDPYMELFVAHPFLW